MRSAVRCASIWGRRTSSRSACSFSKQVADSGARPAAATAISASSRFSRTCRRKISTDSSSSPSSAIRSTGSCLIARSSPARRDAFERDPKDVMRHFVANPPRAAHPVPAAAHFRHRCRREVAHGRRRAGRGDAAILRRIAERIGIPSQPLEKVNASRRRDYRDYYDQPLIDGVAKLYARDLELFGYEF